MTNGGAAYLELADWRRRVAELYAEVRALEATDSRAAHAHWRAIREELYRGHPSSPLPPDRRATFRALHFPHDPGLRFELPVLQGAEPAAAQESPAEAATRGGLLGGLELPASTGKPFVFERAGWLEVPFPGGVRRLALYWLEEYSGGLFLPFRDATSGRETYGGGRYLIDSAKGADLGGDPHRGTIVVDFNFAYQPSCAWDSGWACPLSPPENRLDLPVRAGERLA